jgi:hypothetical protein
MASLSFFAPRSIADVMSDYCCQYIVAQTILAVPLIKVGRPLPWTKHELSRLISSSWQAVVRFLRIARGECLRYVY